MSGKVGGRSGASSGGLATSVLFLSSSETVAVVSEAYSFLRQAHPPPRPCSVGWLPVSGLSTSGAAFGDNTKGQSEQLWPAQQ